LTLGPADSLICKGGQAQLYASGGNSYSWTPATPLTDAASPDPIATLYAPTKFYLSVADVNNCVEQDSLYVAIRPIPTYSAPPDESMCAGFGVKITSENGPGYVYSWSPDAGLDNPSTPSPVASPAQTSSYTLNISDSICPGYDSSFTVTVIVDPSPLVTAKKDNDVDCSVHSAQLHADGALFYSWSPAIGLNSPGSSAPVATIDSTTTYIVKGTGSNGCYAYDSVTVAVTATGANTFVVPNAFTPNGDGHNDCFGVQHWGDVQLEEMEIYNRLGMRVFSTRNPSDCWDGTYHGQPQSTGGYSYVIRAHTYCGEITKTGILMLIR
jgi:gliding motility-associated-like protein